MVRRARLVPVSLLTLAALVIVTAVLATVLLLTSAPADAHRAHAAQVARAVPSPTEGVDLVNGPADNPRDRHGWHGDRFAIPDYIVLTCENRAGDYTLRIRNFHPTRRTASGPYMITRGTWDGFAGYEYAYQAPPYLQDQKAALLWGPTGAGRGHWSSCL